MQISQAKKEKLRANTSFADLHPKYPKGHPKGGQFMPKGSADYINAVAKNTGKSPAAVKASLGNNNGTATPSSLPKQALNEIQNKVRAFNSELENGMIRSTPIRSNPVKPQVTPQVNKKRSAVEEVLQKFGATKQRAAEIADKLIAKFTQTQKKENPSKLSQNAKNKLRESAKKATTKPAETKPKTDVKPQVKNISEYNPVKPIEAKKESKPVSWRDFSTKSESYLGKELEAFEKSRMKPEQVKAELDKWDKQVKATELLNKYKAKLPRLTGENAEKVTQEIAKIEAAIRYKKEVLESTGSPEATAALFAKIFPSKPTPEAIALSKKVDISSDVSQHGKAFWQESMADFFSLTKGKAGKSLRFLEKADDRAFAKPNGVINVGRDRSKEDAKKMLFHEAGHHLEFENPDLVKASKEFIKERGGGKQPQKLNEIIGEKRYNDTEIAYPDHFIDPYVGKVYNSSTEVISMGIENFSDSIKLQRLIKKDREHFLFVHGAIL